MAQRGAVDRAAGHLQHRVDRTELVMPARIAVIEGDVRAEFAGDVLLAGAGGTDGAIIRRRKKRAG
ncbi:MAG TPA: hypothetical protein VND45_10245 [Thermoanaerobaculia bacterium]|nr:hypothetical protein [Thermoanaerobaculia bacterium]